MKSKRIIAVFLTCALLLGTGCGKKQEETEPAPEGTAVETFETASGPMSAEYALTGKIAAVSEVQVFPMLAGQVLSLPVKEGDKVTKGQTLFTVDTKTVTSTYAALQQSYTATKEATDHAIDSARIGLDQAQTAVDNTRALYEAGAAAQQDVTKAEQGLEQAQAGVEQAQAQQRASLAQVQASLDQINTQASLGTVTAPCTGVVTTVNLVRGGMASSAQAALAIAENGAVEVDVSVAEDVYTNIKSGENASVLISAVSPDPMQGVIATLPAAANVQTNLYDVSVSLPSGTTPPIGAFATVTFYTNRRTSTLYVPTEAILTGDDDEEYVYVVSNDGEKDTATKAVVTTGLVGKTNTEILTGLSEGEKVVVKGQSYLSEGALVRVVTGDTTTDTTDAAAPAAEEE